MDRKEATIGMRLKQVVLNLRKPAQIEPDLIPYFAAWAGELDLFSRRCKIAR